MRRILSLFLVVAAMTSATGCAHVTTKVPGTIDMRSDGAEATPDTRQATFPRDVSRTSAEGIFLGDGVQQSGAHVTVVDRKYWALRLVPIVNESATEEIQAATGTGALRKTKIGESETVIDVGVMLVASFVTSFVALSPLVSLIMPSHTVTFEGDRVLDGVDAPAAP